MTGPLVSNGGRSDVSRQFFLIAACAMVLTFTCCGGAAVINEHSPVLASVLTVTGVICFAVLVCSSLAGSIAGIVKYFAKKKRPS